MMHNYNFQSKQDYVLSLLQENIEVVLYSVVCFLIPFLVGHPQFLIGTIVNAALVMAALNFKNYKLLPVILVPSLGVLSRGLLFGPFTIFLIYMVPFIWLGNSIMVFAFKYFNFDRKMNKGLALFISSAMKTGFLFLSAFLLVKVGVLPGLFLTTMGLFQFYTAISGGVVALGMQSLKKKYL